MNLTSFERQLELVMREQQIPGLAIAVVQQSEVTYAKGFGVTSVEDGGQPVTPETIFQIGSVSKPLTATAIMRMAEAGLLDLDTPIQHYLPPFTLRDQAAAATITLRMLLSHTSGLPYDFMWHGPRDAECLGQEIRERFPIFPLVAPPGTAWHYSNANFNLAGHVAETVTGKPFAELMEEWVFAPLAMQRSTFDPTVAITYPLALPHSLSEDNAISVDHRYPVNVPFAPSAFGMSTVQDLANFAIMQMSQGHYTERMFPSTESVTEMHQVHADCRHLHHDRHGLGWFISTYKGQKRVYHDGGIPGFACWFYMLPEAQTAVIITCNRPGGGDQELGQIRDAIFDHLLSLPEQTASTPQQMTPVKPDRTLWPAYCGAYLSPFTGLHIISMQDGHLHLTRNGQPYPLTAIGEHVYVGDAKDNGKYGIKVTFVPDADGTVPLLVSGGPSRKVEHGKAPQPDPSHLRLYVGTYLGKGRTEFYEEVKVRVEDDSLYIFLWGREVKLMALSDTLFVSDWGTFEFVLKEDGTVKHLVNSGLFEVEPAPSSASTSQFEGVKNL